MIKVCLHFLCNIKRVLHGRGPNGGRWTWPSGLGVHVFSSPPSDIPNLNFIDLEMFIILSGPKRSMEVVHDHGLDHGAVYG